MTEYTKIPPDAPSLSAKSVRLASEMNRELAQSNAVKYIETQITSTIKSTTATHVEIHHMALRAHIKYELNDEAILEIERNTFATQGFTTYPKFTSVNHISIIDWSQTPGKSTECCVIL